MPNFKRGSENHIKYLEKQINELRKENEDLKLFQLYQDQDQLLKDIHKDLTESMSLIYSKINNIEKETRLLLKCKKMELTEQQSDKWNDVMENIRKLDKLGNGS